MQVGQHGPVPGGDTAGKGIALHGLLLPAVGDFFAVSVCRQMRQGSGPAVFLRQDHFSGFFSHFAHPGKKGDFKTPGPDAVPVFPVRPDLFHRQGLFRRLVGISDRHVFRGADVCYGIVIHLFLKPAVLDGPAIPACRLFIGNGPAVIFREFRGFRCGAVRHKVNRHGFGPEAVPVLIVLPFLAGLQGEHPGLMGVDQHGDRAVFRLFHRHLRGISFCFFLLPGIADFPSAPLCRHVRHRGSPAIAFRKGHGCCFRPVRKKGNPEGFRAQAVLVIPVVPLFPDRKGLLFRRMGVVKPGYAVFRLLVQGIALRHFFLPGIGNPAAHGIHRQILRRVCPVFFRGKGGRFNFFPVCQEGHVYQRFPQAVLVIHILPDLDHAQIHGLRHMGIGKDSNAVFHRSLCRVAL